jgi:hypothetical protein
MAFEGYERGKNFKIQFNFRELSLEDGGEGETKPFKAER